MTISTGTMNTPSVTLRVALALGIVRATVERISRFAGAAPGTCILRYSQVYARRSDVRMGSTAAVLVDNEYLFRGVVGDGPLVIDNQSDEVQLILYDDKWRMARNTIGQPGIGTTDYGFTDVGLDIVFNPDGRPNKSAAGLDFSTGSSAVYWTLKTIMQFVFDKYVDSTAARVDVKRLGDNYNAQPSSLSLVGQTALQAVDTVASLAGESWGLTPHAAYSKFVPVRTGGYDRRRTVTVNYQNTSAQVTSADEYYANEVSVSPSIRSVNSVFKAVSGRVVIEKVYSNAGANPLLTVSASGLKDYPAKFSIDVTKYAANSLGANLSAGSRPKPILSSLATRLNNNAYVTAAELAADYTKENLPAMDIPIWISADGAEGSAKRVLGNYRIDTKNGEIFFKNKVRVQKDEDGGTEDLQISNWATALVAITLATVIEERESATALSQDTRLPEDFTVVIPKEDLVPVRRYNSWLPSISGGIHVITKVSEGSAEAYIDVTDRLEDVADAAQAGSPYIDNTVSLGFHLFPFFDIGDLLQVRGRDVGMQGNEVVTEVLYDVDERFETRIKATNVPASLEVA